MAFWNSNLAIAIRIKLCGTIRDLYGLLLSDVRLQASKEASSRVHFPPLKRKDRLDSFLHICGTHMNRYKPFAACTYQITVAPVIPVTSY